MRSARGTTPERARCSTIGKARATIFSPFGDGSFGENPTTPTPLRRRDARRGEKRRAAPTRSRASRDPQIFSGVSTRNFTRVPAPYSASSSRDDEEEVVPSGVPSARVSGARADAPFSIDATAVGSAVRTRTASSRVSVARAAVASISSTQSAVAMASLYEDPTRCLSSSSLASASRAARARTSRISSKLLDSNRASALRSFSARVFASPDPGPPVAAGSAGATIVATGRAAECARASWDDARRFQRPQAL